MELCPVQATRRYRFRLADVICPDREQMRLAVTGELEVTGEVMFLSDRGLEPDRFAILSVAGLGSPVIVPVDRLRSSRSCPDRKDAAIQAQDG